MHGPVVLIILSLAGVAVALWVPGWSDLLLLAGPCAVAAAYLLLRALRRPPPPGKRIILDGSNIMHWTDGQPDLRPVRDVLRTLRARGIAPSIVFDANAGYKLEGQYKNDTALARSLGIPRDRVMVVPRGTTADEVILRAARDLNVPIISNDRFRDWHDAHPEVTRQGRLVRGGYRKGTLWLALPEDDPHRQPHR